MKDNNKGNTKKTNVTSLSGDEKSLCRDETMETT